MQVCSVQHTCVHVLLPVPLLPLACTLYTCCLHSRPCWGIHYVPTLMQLLTLLTLAALTHMHSEVPHWQGCLRCCCRYCCWLTQQPGSGCGTHRSGSRLLGLCGTTPGHDVSLEFISLFPSWLPLQPHQSQSHVPVTHRR